MLYDPSFYEDRLKVSRDPRHAVWNASDEDYERVRVESTTICKQHLRAGMKVLDAGCGVGDLIQCLPEGIEYTGVDFCDGFIKVASKKYPERRFIVCNLLTLPFDDDSFDAVLCRHTQGVLSTDWDKVKVELLRVAKTLFVWTVGDEIGDTLDSLTIEERS